MSDELLMSHEGRVTTLVPCYPRVRRCQEGIRAMLEKRKPLFKGR